jgi:diguanylate cyclase (GGDEF)-like protein
MHTVWTIETPETPRIAVSETTATDVVRGLEAIIDAAAGVLAEKSLEATLEGMVTALSPIVSFTSLALYEADHAERVLVPKFARGRFVEETLADRPPFDASIAGTVVTSGKMAHLDPDDPRQAPYTIPDTPDDEPAAIVVVPLSVAGTVIGTLTVWREGPDQPVFTAAEAQLIGRFGTLAALAYSNAQQRDLLREQALTDPLTGLANRRHFEDRLTAEVARAGRDGTPTALILFDIDDFKAINDRYGHPAGDAALRGFGEVLRSQARASDLVCRVGGEEFAVILPGTQLPAARTYAERMIARTRATELAAVGPVTASAGLAAAPLDATTGDALVDVADERLLRAKAGGKDRVDGG